MSRLDTGHETNAGLSYKLLSEVAGRGAVSLYYEAGVQWPDWWHTMDVVHGRGINRMIRRAYGFLASRYRPGDRIFLLGYSRGAYAVRSLAGVIDSVGLLRTEHATERMVVQAYRHYQTDPNRQAAQVFAHRYCHPETAIEMVGCWDTVKALGLRLPLLWRLTEAAHAFHNHALGRSVRHGYHALALHETREAFAPVLWETPEGLEGRIEQMWFRGSHGDVGGQLGGFLAARPLSNIPLVWLLGKAEALDLPLPEGWRARFPTDPEAPPTGNNRGWGRLFVLRKKRVAGLMPTESFHPTTGVARSGGADPGASPAPG